MSAKIDCMYIHEEKDKTVNESEKLWDNAFWFHRVNAFQSSREFKTVNSFWCHPYINSVIFNNFSHFALKCGAF